MSSAPKLNPWVDNPRSTQGTFRAARAAASFDPMATATASTPAGPEPPADHPGRVTAIYTGLGRFVVRFRWAILGFWILVVVATAALMPSLANEINGNNSAFLKSSEPSIKAANLAAPLTGAGIGTKNTSIQVVAAAKAPLTSADELALEQLIQRITTVPSVESVSLAGVSKDAEAAQLLIRAAASQSDIAKDKTLITDIQASFAKVKLPPGLQVNLAGQIATAVANQDQSNQQGKQTQIFSVLFVIALLLIVFRSPLAALITLIPALFALLISMRVVAAIASSGALQISDITQILLIVLLIGAGTDYGLFLRLGPVPMEFDRLVNRTLEEPEVRAALQSLVARKQAGDELAAAPPVTELSHFVEDELVRLAALDEADDSCADAEELNRFFRRYALAA